MCKITAQQLKEYIKNNSLIVTVLENVGCHKIHETSNQLRCALPNHSNPNSLCVWKDTLAVKSYDDTLTFNGDIFTLIMKLRNISFVDSIRYLHKLLNLPFINVYRNIAKEERINDLSSIFLKAKQVAHCKDNNKCEELTIFNSLNNEEYLFLPHINWIREGILPKAIKKFNIGYDIKSKRIIIPHRLWYGNDNDWVGITGRTTLKNYELLGIPKYMSMRKERYPKTMNVYGLQENHNSIDKAGYVTVFEAEKSVLKRYSWGDETGVAICGHTISPEQEKILISLDTDIIIAMDRGISRFQVRELCEKFYNIRKVYYMWDEYDVILHDKESPADLSNDLYAHMFKYKILYDNKEHEQYIVEKQKIEQERGL